MIPASTPDSGRILVIEDEPRLRIILKKQLEDAKDVKYEVRTAEDGLKATKAQLAGLEYTTGWDLVGTLLRARCISTSTRSDLFSPRSTRAAARGSSAVSGRTAQGQRRSTKD